MTRSKRLAGYIAVGVLSGLLFATVAIWLLSRSEWGMERVRVLTIGWLDEHVAGEVRMGRISGPGLFGGIVIHDVAIIDSAGRPFLEVDSLRVGYNIRRLLGGAIVLDDAVLYRPRVVLEQLPGDAKWNFETVFPDPTPDEPEQRRLIALNDVRIIDGTVTVRFGFDPDPPITADDTARIIVERFPRGLARVLRFEGVNARADRVVWETPIEPGRLFEFSSIRTLAYIYREPTDIRDGRGTVTMRDSVVSFDIPELEMPSSVAAVLGRVILHDDRNDIDVRVTAQRFGFSDLQWLHPQIPVEGGGSIVLHIRSQTNGTLFLAEDVRVSTPGTNVAGSFGVVTGDSLYFTNVDLRASPLDVGLIERILPGRLPVEGLLIGTVEVRGPLSALETSGDLRFANAGDGNDSRVSWRGVLDMRGGTVSARSLNADVRHLELALVSAFAPGFRLTGSVSGTVTASGRRGETTFSALLEHATTDGVTSTFDGSGSFGRIGQRFDVTLDATPVSIHELARQVPALGGLEGMVSGPVHVEGTPDDLSFRAALQTAGGPVDVSGRTAGSGDMRRIAVTAEANGFRPDALKSGLPSTMMSGRVTLDLTGSTLATVAGPVQVVLDSTRFGEFPSSSLVLDGRMGNGLLEVDSAVLRGPLGTGRARGTLSLIAGVIGRLEAGFRSQSLTALEPFLYRNRGPAQDGEPRVAGRVDALATITGWARSLDIEASAVGDDILLGPVSAKRMHAETTARGVGSDHAGFRLVANADAGVVFDHRLEAARLELTGAGDSLAVAMGATAGGEPRMFMRGSAHRGSHDGTLSSFTAHLAELRLGGATPWLLESPATVHVSDGIASIDSAVVSRAAGGRVSAHGRLAWAQSVDGLGEPIDFGISVGEVPFADLLGAMRATASGAGTVSGALRVRGNSLDPLVEAEIYARDIVYGDVRMDLAFAELNYGGLGMDAHAEAQYGGRRILVGGGRIPIDLRLADIDERRLAEPLRMTLTADSLPPGLPLGLLRGFSNVGGRLDGMMLIGGTTLDPTLSGGFTIRNGTADWDVSGVRYSDVTGNFVLEQGRLLRVDLSALSADPRGRSGLSLGNGAAVGNGTVKGSIDFTELADPSFALSMRANGVYAAKRRDVEARVSGEVRLGGRYTRPELGGELRVVDGALYIEELYRQYLIAGVALDDPSLFTLVDTSLVAVRPIIAASRNPFLKNLVVEGMQVEIGADSWLRSRDMDVEVRGNLSVEFDRRDADLRLGGSLNVDRGTYTLYYPPLQSRRFQVRQGIIDFPGTPGVDPNLAITGVYRARARGEPLDVLAVVSGTLQNPRVHLSSDVQPPISESDLASYLFFGVPTWEVANATGPDQNRFSGLGGALTPSVLGYASSGLQTLVQNAGLLDYVGLTTVESAAPSRSDAALANLLAETQLEIGSYLTSDLYVGMSKRLGTSTLDPGVRLEWRFLPEYSFELFAEDRLARAPGFGLRQEAGLRKVYGFSLFREWGF